jgi:hypothetical protein
VGKAVKLAEMEEMAKVRVRVTTAVQAVQAV